MTLCSALMPLISIPAPVCPPGQDGRICRSSAAIWLANTLKTIKEIDVNVTVFSFQWFVIAKVADVSVQMSNSRSTTMTSKTSR